MSKGHAARRREGQPANAYGDLGAGTRSHQSHTEAMDQAVLANSPRVAMGSTAYAAQNASGMPSPNTIPRPKAKGPTGDLAGSKGGPRKPILAERLGARYAISVKTPGAFDHAAGPTMQSARIVPSVAGRQSPNFGGGSSGSY